MNVKTANLLLLITAIFWGMGYIGTDILVDEGMSSISIIGMRFLIASILLIIIFFKKLKFDKVSLIGSFIIGLVLFLSFLAQTLGMENTTTTKVSFITGSNVVFVPLIMFVLYRKKIEIKHLISVLLTIIGLAFLTGGMTDFNYGDFLTFICAFFFGLHIVLINHYSKKIDIYMLAIGQMFVVSLLSFIIAPFFHTNIIYETQNINFIVLLLVGIIPSALCFLLQNIGLKYTDPGKGSIILATESLWGGIFAISFLGEPLNLSIVIGGIILFTAVLVDEIKGK